MLSSTSELLQAAQSHAYAIGAFNVYNLEGVRAVVNAAEASSSPAMLQIHPSALAYGGAPLVALCLEAARSAAVAIAVHLDHSTSSDDIQAALEAGMTSIMADGSHLSYGDNLSFTREMATLAHTKGAVVEAEIGRISGSEDGLTVAEYQAKMTDPVEAADFVSATQVDALAVTIGNVHGKYQGEPQLDFKRLSAIRESVDVPLVLHGASGLPEAMIHRSIELGVCKFNVNTEVRQAYLRTLRESLNAPDAPDLLELMERAIAAMQEVVSVMLQRFGSVGKVSSSQNPKALNNL
jgi:tagatose 1,6-diphosphate aldolase GatY/KbaY